MTCSASGKRVWLAKEGRSSATVTEKPKSAAYRQTGWAIWPQPNRISRSLGRKLRIYVVPSASKVRCGCFCLHLIQYFLKLCVHEMPPVLKMDSINLSALHNRGKYRIALFSAYEQAGRTVLNFCRLEGSGELDEKRPLSDACTQVMRYGVLSVQRHGSRFPGCRGQWTLTAGMQGRLFLLQQQNVPRLDRDPDQLVINTVGASSRSSSIRRRGGTGRGPLRPQQNNGGEYILNDPLPRRRGKPPPSPSGAAVTWWARMPAQRTSAGTAFPQSSVSPPLGQCHRISRRNGLHDVFAPGEPGGSLRLRLMEQLPQGKHSLRLPCSITQTFYSSEIPRPGHGTPTKSARRNSPENRKLNSSFHFRKLSRAENGSSSKMASGRGAEDAGQRHPLLLSAGKLGGIVMLQPLQPEAAEGFRQRGGLFPLLPARMPQRMFFSTVMVGNRA